MSITVVCQCGKQLRAGDHQAGLRVKCRTCQTVFTIPGQRRSTKVPVEDRQAQLVDQGGEDSSVVVQVICGTLFIGVMVGLLVLLLVGISSRHTAPSLAQTKTETEITGMQLADKTNPAQPVALATTRKDVTGNASTKPVPSVPGSTVPTNVTSLPTESPKPPPGVPQPLLPTHADPNPSPSGRPDGEAKPGDLYMLPLKAYATDVERLKRIKVTRFDLRNTGNGFAYDWVIAWHDLDKWKIAFAGKGKVVTVVVNGDKAWRKRGSQTEDSSETEEITDPALISAFKALLLAIVGTSDLPSLQRRGGNFLVEDKITKNGRTLISIKAPNLDVWPVRLFFDEETQLLAQSTITFTSGDTWEVHFLDY